MGKGAGGPCMSLAYTPVGPLLFLGFNQDQGCFACGLDSGFRIFNVDPFKETFRRDFHSGIGVVEMLFRCNILALVGGGKNPRHSPNKVMIWDDHQCKCIGELTFQRDVKAVKLRRDRVVVALEFKTYVYNFSDLKLLNSFDTAPNPSGLVAVAPNSNNMVFACPALHKGHVRVELSDIKKTTFISAHEGPLSALALNLDGTLLATASEKGTLVRVFETHTGQLQYELRRGMEKAVIHSICFSHNSRYLAVTSDKKTVHIFALGDVRNSDRVEAPAARAGGGSDDALHNRRSSLSFMSRVLPKYFSSEWSFAQFKVPDTRSICAFGSQENTLVIACSNGSFYKCSFDAHQGGDCVQEEVYDFLAAKP